MQGKLGLTVRETPMCKQQQNKYADRKTEFVLQSEYPPIRFVM